MILPKRVIKKQPEKTGKYSDSAVKMLGVALDDLVMVRYKSGWFTLLKFTE